MLFFVVVLLLMLFDNKDADAHLLNSYNSPFIKIFSMVGQFSWLYLRSREENPGIVNHH